MSGDRRAATAAEGKSGEAGQPAKVVGAGLIGAVLGGLGTLVGETGVEALLANNYLVGLATLCLLVGCALALVAALRPTTRGVLNPSMAMASVFVLVAVMAGAATFAPPPTVLVKFRASPQNDWAETLMIAGDSSVVPLTWTADLPYPVRRDGVVTINLEKINRYFERTTAKCLTTITRTQTADAPKPGDAVAASDVSLAGGY